MDNKIFNQLYTIEEVLKYIVTSYGTGIYKEEKRLSNLIADLYIGDNRLKRVYCRAVLDDFLSVRVYNLSLKPLSCRKSFYNQIISSFCELNFYPLHFGQQIVDSFIAGIDFPISISRECEELFEKSYNGDAVAQNRLGFCFDKGKGIEQDYGAAISWYHKSAGQGNIEAQKHLGSCYYFGNGIKQDYKEAVKYYRKAAEQGDDEAQYNLGKCLFYGKGTKINITEGIKWFERSAKQGNIKSLQKIKSYNKSQIVTLYKLGVSYLKGYGVKKDHEKALCYFLRAADLGDLKSLKAWVCIAEDLIHFNNLPLYSNK